MTLASEDGDGPKITGWALDIREGDVRIEVRPMIGTGGPYEMKAFGPDGKQLIQKIGERSVTGAIEAAVSTFRVERIDVNADRLMTIGRRVDQRSPW